MKNFAWRKCQMIFLEAIFFSFSKTFLKVNSTKHKMFVIISLVYHWLRKFPNVFQPIIFQNYDLYFQLGLHFLRQ